MKRSCLIIASIIFILCASCTNSIPPEYYQWAENVCQLNGGLKELTITGPLWPDAICKNGAEFSSSSRDFISKDSADQPTTPPIVP